MNSYNGTAPFVAGSDTSREAAESIQPAASSMRFRVLMYIKATGRTGSTDDEIEEALNMRHQTASARRRELVLSGHVEDSTRRRKTRSGRNATVWVYVPPEVVS